MFLLILCKQCCVYYRFFQREVLGKKGIDKRSMPKLFGAWHEKTLKTYMFTTGQDRAFTSAKHMSCPWYMECSKKFCPTSEEEEKASRAVATQVMDQDSEDAEVEEILVEVVDSTMKKSSKKISNATALKATKSTKETKKVKETKTTDGSSSKDKGKAVTSPSIDVAPPPSDADAFTISNPSYCPRERLSVSTEIFTASEIYAKNALRIDTHGIEPELLTLCTSIPAIFHFMEENHQLSPELHNLRAFAQKVRCTQWPYFFSNLFFWKFIFVCLNEFFSIIPFFPPFQTGWARRSTTSRRCSQKGSMPGPDYCRYARRASCA